MNDAMLKSIKSLTGITTFVALIDVSTKLIVNYLNHEKFLIEAD